MTLTQCISQYLDILILYMYISIHALPEFIYRVINRYIRLKIAHKTDIFIHDPT